MFHLAFMFYINYHRMFGRRRPHVHCVLYAHPSGPYSPPPRSPDIRR